MVLTKDVHAICVDGEAIDCCMLRIAGSTRHFYCAKINGQVLQDKQRARMIELVGTHTRGVDLVAEHYLPEI